MALEVQVTLKRSWPTDVMNAEEVSIERIEQSLDTTRPYLRADGGDVKLLRFRPEGVLEASVDRHVCNLPYVAADVTGGIERAVMKDVPEVHRVEAVTL